MVLLTTLEPDVSIEQRTARRFYLCSCESLDQLSAKFEPSSKYFRLAIAVDALNISDDLIRKTARTALQRGFSSLCVWGRDCERVHDLFDDAERELHLPRGASWTSTDVVMTTRHANETLDQALWHFAWCSIPTEYLESESQDCFVAVIGNPVWEREVRENFGEVISQTKDV